MNQSISIQNSSAEFVSNQLSAPNLTVVNQFKKGKFIYQEGALAKKFYCLKKGLLLMGTQSENGKSSFSHLVFEGEYFGEEVLLGFHSRNSFALVLSNEAAVEECPEGLIKVDVNELLRSVFVQKMERFQQTLMRNSTLALKQRIQSVLKEIALGFGVRLLNGDVLIRTHLKHRELALLSNATRQSVTTCLLELVREGKVLIDKDSLLVNHQLMAVDFN